MSSAEQLSAARDILDAQPVPMEGRAVMPRPQPDGTGTKRYRFIKDSEHPTKVTMQYIAPCFSAIGAIMIENEQRLDRGFIARSLMGLRYETREFIRKRELAPLIPIASLFPGLGKKKQTELERIGFMHRGR